MRFIEFLQRYEDAETTYCRAIPLNDIVEIQERTDGSCDVFVRESEGVDIVTSPTPYRDILSQINGHDSHDTGDVFGVRASEIVAVQEGARGCVEVVLKNGLTLTRSDVSLQEFLTSWREG